MLFNLFPKTSGQQSRRRMTEGLEHLHALGLLKFIAAERGKARLRTSGHYILEVHGKILYVGTNDLDLLCFGMLLGSEHAVRPDGTLNTLIPGAFYDSLVWHLDNRNTAAEKIAAPAACDMREQSAPCQVCRTGNSRQVAPGKCTEQLTPAEQEEHDGYGFHGCAACWRKVAMWLGAENENVIMIGQLYHLLSETDQARITREHPQVAEVLARYVPPMIL